MYKKSNSDSQVIRIQDGAYIPFDAGNADYREFVSWIEAGNQPQDADPVTEPSAQ